MLERQKVLRTKQEEKTQKGKENISRRRGRGWHMQRGRARSIYHLEPVGSCPPYFFFFQLVRPSKGKNQDGFNRQYEYVSSAAYCCHEYIPVKYPLAIQWGRFDGSCL